MRYFFIILLLAGCKSNMVYVPVKEVHREIEIQKDTLIEFKLIPYFSENTTTKDSSFIENKYAYSTAIWDGINLKHSLGMKDSFQTILVKVTQKHTIDSIPYPVEVEKIVYKDIAYKLRWYDEALKNIGILSLVIIFFYLLIRYLNIK